MSEKALAWDMYSQTQCPGSAGRNVPMAGPVREQPHFVLGPKSTCHEGWPCGAKRGVRLRQGYGGTSPKLKERRRAPFAATRLWHVTPG